MKRKILRSIIAFLMLCVELYFLYAHRENILELIPFLSVASENFFDDVCISFVGTVAFTMFQFANCFLFDFLVAGFPRVVLFVAQNIFRYDVLTLETKIYQMIQFLFSTNCKWGVTQKTNVLKNANTAEGLIACANVLESGLNLSEQEIGEVQAVLKQLVSQLKPDGYESFNESVCTVHCTGMVLYGIKRFVDLELFELSEDDEKKIWHCLHKLLSNANECGWGFINQKYDNTIYNRTLSTIWALRALNAWGLSNSRKYKRVIRNLLQHTNGVLGFSIGSTPKYSATAMLHILIHELNNESLKKELGNCFCKKEVLSYLLGGLKYEVEVEEFVTSAENAKKLPWTHFTECMVLEALPLFLKEMNILQILKMSFYIRKITAKMDSNQYYYLVETMDFRHSDPFCYPTTYLITTLCKLCAFLQKTNTITW